MIQDFQDFLEQRREIDPPPPYVKSYRIETWVLWVAIIVLTAATIASGAHNIPTIQSTLPPEWPSELRWFVAFAGFLAFDVGLFLAAYFLFFFQYRGEAQRKLSEAWEKAGNGEVATIENPVGNRWVLVIGAILTIVYTVIANISAAGTELLEVMPAELKSIVVLGMGVIPLWAFFAGEYVARIRAHNSVAGEVDEFKNYSLQKSWQDAQAKRWARILKKQETKQETKQGTKQPALSKQEVSRDVEVSGELTANLNSRERGQLFRRAWNANPAQFEGQTYRQIADAYGISSAAVSNIRNGK